MQVLSLDFESAEGELRQIDVAAPGDMDEFFAREWARNVFSAAIESLREDCEAKGKQTHFRLLELYDIEEGGRQLTYEDLARWSGIKTTDVINHLAYARKEFRRIVLAELRTMTASEEEFRREAHTLLGVKL